MAIPHNRRDTFDASQLFRGALGIAASDENSRFRIDPVDASDECPCAPVGFGRYAAGVHDDYVGCTWRVFSQTAGPQALAHRFAISPGRAAPEVLNMECGTHMPSLRGFPSLTAD